MLSEARVGPTYFTIILQSSVGRGEAHFWVQVPPRKSPPDLKFRRPFSESSESSKSVRDPSYAICTIQTLGSNRNFPRKVCGL